MITKTLITKSGIEFVCENNECIAFQTGFTINSVWPMGEIDAVINSKIVEKNEDLKRHIVEQKAAGDKFAKICYPDNDNIPVVAYMVDFWSASNKCVGHQVFELNGRTIEQAVKEDEIKPICTEKCSVQSCNDKKDFNCLIEEGIFCPHCGKKMKKNAWFCKNEEE